MKCRIISFLLLLSLTLSMFVGCDLINSNISNKEDVQYTLTLDNTELNLKVGESQKLNAVVSPKPEESLIIQWKSLNKSVAIVEDGVVCAIATGSAIIEASLPNGEHASCVVIVTANNDNSDNNSNNNSNENNNNTPINPGNGSNNDHSEVFTSTYDGSEITITFSHTMSEALRKELDKAIKRFNEIYPNITVEHSQVGGYDEVRDQIKTELIAGNQPNIAYCYPDHVALYNVTKKVVPLDNFIESQIPDSATGGIIGLTEEQKADFITSFYNEGTVFDVAGTMYTMPMSKSTEVLYYNATFFAEHNLKVPTTWEEMEAVCAQIKDILANDDNPNNDADVPLGYDSESNWFITMCEQYGSNYTSTDPSNHFLFNNKTNRDFVKMFREWYEKGYVTTQEIYGAYTSALFTNTDPSKPTCYMCIGSTGGAAFQAPPVVYGQYKFTVGIAAIPQVNPDAPKAISQGPSLCIFYQDGDYDKFDDTQEVIASWLFVKFITTNAEFQASFSMVSGYMPVINSATEVTTYVNWLKKANGTDNLVALVIKSALENTESYFIPPSFHGSSKARDQVGVLLQYCLINSPASGVSVDDFILEAFKKAINECLSDY